MNALSISATPWDERPLGLRTAEFKHAPIEPGQKCDWLGIQNTEVAGRLPDVIYGRLPADDIEALAAAQHAGFHFVECSMDLALKLNNAWSPPKYASKPLSIEPAKSADIEAVEELAASMFEYGRFAEDPVFAREKVALRQRSMVRDLHKQGASVHVTRANGQVAGFMISKRDTAVATSQLILGGVDPNFRMLTYRFWATCLESQRSTGSTLVTTRVSAANVPVLNLYSAFGFSVTSTLWGVRWLRRGAKSE
ncbi:hypothetical protein AWH62_15885 [Maricaulis sp. W15]|uniref:hypothetical protein n=1 Tax=Maricaulis sp. W15 TaxID=1772333 RepID=UPI000948D578|nr:hypothetical protein [Maricaulis sp. W15]OLF78252.1 hypothetical protein AWH62_15885 [Maricaulis sp. W15]